MLPSFSWCFSFPFLALYLIVTDETSNPTTMTRAEAEKLAQELGGRPSADHNQTTERDSTDDADQWGSDYEWGSETNNRR